MHLIETVLLLLLAVVVSGSVARITRIALPLVQIGLGAVIVLATGTTVDLKPDIFFLLFLPPLLFLDGWRIPKEALFRDRAVILELALGLVLFTVIGLGFMIWFMIPEMPLPVAFALAAILIFVPRVTPPAPGSGPQPGTGEHHTAACCRDLSRAGRRQHQYVGHRPAVRHVSGIALPLFPE